MGKHTNLEPVIWVIADDRPGNANQAIGVAEQMPFPFVQKNICYGARAGMHNFLKGASLIGVDIDKSDALTAPWPDIVIAAGRRTAPIARYIKKQSGGKSFLVQMMWPGFPCYDIDLIFTPTHDNRCVTNQVMHTIGAPHRVTQARLASERALWKEVFADLPDTKIAVLVGGDAGNRSFTTEHAQELADLTNKLANEHQAGILITTSRRTSDAAVDVLERSIQEPRFFYRWGKSKGDNPFFGFLACSDMIIATGESMSMCSESCASGKPVYIYAPASLVTDKHRFLHQALYDQHYARPLESVYNDSRDEVWNDAALHEAKKVADAILTRFRG